MHRCTTNNITHISHSSSSARFLVSQTFYMNTMRPQSADSILKFNSLKKPHKHKSILCIHTHTHTRGHADHIGTWRTQITYTLSTQHTFHPTITHTAIWMSIAQYDDVIVVYWHSFQWIFFIYVYTIRSRISIPFRVLAHKWKRIYICWKSKVRMCDEITTNETPSPSATNRCIGASIPLWLYAYVIASTRQMFSLEF